MTNPSEEKAKSEWVEFRGNYFKKSEIVGVRATHFGGVKISLKNEQIEYRTDDVDRDIRMIMQKIWGTWVEDIPINNDHLGVKNG